jgi:hypothetical protein
MHDFQKPSPKPVKIQPKLQVNEPGDSFEQEADAMADSIMKADVNQLQPVQQNPVTGLIGRSVQRKCASCEEEEKKLMRKEQGGVNGGTVSSSFSSSLTNAGNGIPLQSGTKEKMEHAFNTDFSAVRIHTGQQASELNNAVQAKAFTYGNDIYFNKGEYKSDTYEGKKLLAHELTHVVQQNSGVHKIARQERDSSTCSTRFSRATNFHELINLVHEAEVRLNAAGIRSARDQVHALRGIYYGTTWSLDYSVERSLTRNEGFQRFTRPSAATPSSTTPPDVRSYLDCGLFSALLNSQDISDGHRHLDFGHLIIALDARFDPSFNVNVQYPNPISSLLPGIDLGGTGPELVTWLGDLGGGAASLASSRVLSPSTNVSSVFRGSDYGGSINLEGDIAGFVIATTGTPTAPQSATTGMAGSSLSDSLRSYLGTTSTTAAWRNRATTFLRMYGAIFNSSNALTNGSSLISTFASRIQVFACNYLASRVQDHHITFAQASAASGYINNAAQEVATAFVNALEDSHTTGNRIEATRFPTPTAGTSSACQVQITAGAALGM